MLVHRYQYLTWTLRQSNLLLLLRQRRLHWTWSAWVCVSPRAAPPSVVLRLEVLQHGAPEIQLHLLWRYCRMLQQVPLAPQPSMSMLTCTSWCQAAVLLRLLQLGHVSWTRAPAVSLALDNFPALPLQARMLPLPLVPFAVLQERT